MSRFDATASGRDNIAESRYHQERRRTGPEPAPAADDAVIGEPGAATTRTMTAVSRAVSGRAGRVAGTARRYAKPAAAVVLLAGAGAAVAAMVLRSRRMSARTRMRRRLRLIRR